MKATRKYKTKENSFVLQLKIIIGYAFLLISLSAIIALVWFEHRKMEELNKSELYIREKNEAVNLTFEKLLDFSFSDEILLIRDKEKFDEYQIKRKIATNALNTLKQYYLTDKQHSKIDRVSSLLLEKEELLRGVMNILSEISRIDSLFQQKIPVITAKTQQNGTNKRVEKKRSKFLELFKKKENKSAYARQQEKKEQLFIPQLITGQLYSLQKEIHEQYTDYWHDINSYADSLQQRNTELNLQINELIYEFEQAAVIQTDKDVKELTTLREQSFRIILLIAATAILLIVVFYVFIHHDIRKRLEYRMNLEASDRRNRELLAARRNLILTVSHDLRVPLGTISEYAELIQDERNSEQKKGYAMNILRASRHVIGLANNLLYYYRLEAEKEQLEKEIFHLGRTVEDTANLFIPAAEKKGLGLTIEVTDSDVLVEGDAGRLVQILNNLLSNAVKFTHTGYIHLRAQYRNGRLCFFVRDTGTGIDEDRKERIFTAFERGETPDTEQGFGLGLAITYKLVMLLGGTICVQSTLGHGSTFEVCLPMREADGRTETVKYLPEHSDLSGMRVLAIDDDRMQLDVIQKMYACYGVECDCCLNVGELIAALRHNRYDLVLTDMRMPEIDGYGILALLRGSNIGQTKTLPVLVLTAQADELSEHFRNAGFTDCLHKPFSSEELLAATSHIGRPDFTAIIDGEEDTRELLDMFIEDTEEELARIRDAFNKGDYEQLGHIIHKAAPLWSMIRIGVPLRELEEMASLPPEKWGNALDKRIERVIEVVEQAVEKAKELKNKADENHIDSRG